MALNIGLGLDKTTTTGTQSQTADKVTTSQKNLSQAAIDKLVYDVLSSDTGLASLATGENLSGGYAASTKALLAQDFVVKLVGELANVTAATTSTERGTAASTSSSKSSKKSGGLKTVICTELYHQGLLLPSLYEHPAAAAHFSSLHSNTIRGYHFWALPVVAWMQKSPALSRALLPIAHGRYVQVTTGKYTFSGVLTIHVGQPICFVIGSILEAMDKLKGKKYGNVH